ncbi:site-specific integrase [Kribbella sp. NBC_01510]|uniref:tyrosine-type recombinase/integrase n=1 Tax=Kribbella sp. NBC_01510 TaxID=2903581 RepID=UPI00386CF537
MTSKEHIHKETLQDGRTRYWFRVGMKDPRTGRYVRPRYTFDTWKEAKAERGRMLSERDRGTAVVRTKITVAEWVQQWLEVKGAGSDEAGTRTVKPSTLRYYRDTLQPVVKRYGTVKLQELSTRDLEKLKQEMLSGEARVVGRRGAPMSARSVNATIGSTHAVLKSALQQQLIYINPAEAVARVTSRRTAAKVRQTRGSWQPENSQAFLRHIADHRLTGAWWLSMLGLRRGEVLGLRWSSVDFEAGQFTVDHNRVVTAGVVYDTDTKAEASDRTLPLPAPVAAALRETRRHQAAEKLRAGEAYSDQGLVVVDEIGKPYRPEYYSDLFVALSADAGLPRIPLHGARHAAASLLAANGVPIVDAARWLGQSQTSITERYQHAFDEGLKAAGDKLAAALSGIVAK